MLLDARGNEKVHTEFTLQYHCITTGQSTAFALQSYIPLLLLILHWISTFFLSWHVQTVYVQIPLVNMVLV